MLSTKVKIPAKINLTLDVVGKENGYHTLNSVVANIGIYDIIYAKKRRDKRVVISVKGYPISCDLNRSNAYRAGVEFIKKFNTLGADIVIKRNIKEGAGLGGSSADIVGVLKAMAKLYKIDELSTLPIANLLGSDCAFMYYGGYAKMQGRGEIIEKINYNKKLYIILGIAEGGVSTKECFALYDESEVKPSNATEKVVDLMEKNQDFLGELKNDLYIFASTLNKNVTELYNKLGKDYKVMSGSGSSVYSVFYGKAERDRAYKELKDKNLVKTNTII